MVRDALWLVYTTARLLHERAARGNGQGPDLTARGDDPAAAVVQRRVDVARFQYYGNCSIQHRSTLRDVEMTAALTNHTTAQCSS